MNTNTTMNETMWVFTYGTLMTGQPNHRLLVGARRIGTARTEPRYDLLDLGAFPGMAMGGATAVMGEVYEVDRPTLAALDRLEGHPRFYIRRRIRLESGEEVAAYIFPRRPQDCPAIPSGDWRAVKGA